MNIGGKREVGGKRVLMGKSRGGFVSFSPAVGSVTAFAPPTLIY